MHRGKRHFGRRNHEQIDRRIAEHRVGELRELTRRPHRRLRNQYRRIDLEVTVTRGAVEEERRNRARQPRAGTAQDRKPAARNLRRAFGIEDAQCFADLPMRLGLEGVPARFAPRAHDAVVLFTRTVGNGAVEHVGHVAEQRGHLLVECRQLSAGFGDARVERGDRGLEARGFRGAVGGFGDRRGDPVLLRFQALGGREGGSALVIEFEDTVDESVALAAAARGDAHAFRVVAHKVEVEH